MERTIQCLVHIFALSPPPPICPSPPTKLTPPGSTSTSTPKNPNGKSPPHPPTHPPATALLLAHPRATAAPASKTLIKNLILTTPPAHPPTSNLTPRSPPAYKQKKMHAPAGPPPATAARCKIMPTRQCLPPRRRISKICRLGSRRRAS